MIPTLTRGVNFKGNMMSWNKEGQQITALYNGITVSGTVESSRVKYGGMVQHVLLLKEPIQLIWRNELADRLLIDEDEVMVDKVAV